MLKYKTLIKNGSLEVRKPDLAYKRLKPYVSNYMVQNHLSLLSALFPEGEKFFVDAVRLFQHSIKDENLKEEVRGFIGQEAMHSREHANVNARLEENGHDVLAFQDGIKRPLEFLANISTPKARLAITMCAEHFTAIMAQELLDNHRIQNLFIDKEAQKLWLWHAIEESEHKNVTYDVWKDAGFSETERKAWMVAVSAIFVPLVIMNGLRFARPHKLKLNGLIDIVQGFKLLYGKKGFYTNIIPQYLDWFKTDFNPRDHDSPSLKLYKDVLFS